MAMIRGSRIHCSPAFGRDYKTEEEVLKDWEDGKDFRMENRPQTYISKSDAETYGVPKGEINVRFNKKSQVCVISNLKVNNDM